MRFKFWYFVANIMLLATGWQLVSDQPPTCCQKQPNNSKYNNILSKFTPNVARAFSNITYCIYEWAAVFQRYIWYENSRFICVGEFISGVRVFLGLSAAYEWKWQRQEQPKRSACALLDRDGGQALPLVKLIMWTNLSANIPIFLTFIIINRGFPSNILVNAWKMYSYAKNIKKQQYFICDICHDINNPIN